MSKLFGWFSKNKKADKQKTTENETEHATLSETNRDTSNETSTEPQGSSDMPDVTVGEDTQEATQQPVEENVTPLEVPGSDAEDDVLTTQSPITPSETENLMSDQAPEATRDEGVPVEADAIVDTPTAKDDVSVDTASVSEAVSATERVVDTAQTEEAVASLKQESATPIAQEKKEKKSLFSRLKDSLSRTKANLGSGFVSLFKGKTIDDELYEDLETQLLVADVGMDTTQKIITHLTDSASRKDLKDAEALLDILKQQMSDMLAKVNQPLPDVMQSHDAQDGPFVILMVGVNGVGKTTTIGKLAKQFEQQGKKVMLAAGDTFRAAAVEQLQVWGERNNIPVIAQHTGADSASVLYDALEAAKSRKCDVLIADTAGRLQNKNNLMEELKKVVRVMKKLNPNAPHEVMLTLDAGTGQNAVSQAKLFNEAVGLTGITLTKLDGTAKGGVIFSIADQFGIPIRYIGVGEGIDDLRQFDGQEFIDALFSEIESGDVAK